MNNEYKITIGLEVHVELSTNTKAYCRCKNEFGKEPNTNICPICMGLPGALPAFNENVLKYAIRAGLATNCSIANDSKFDRKNYFYPDLVKGYQITQDDKPIAYEGYLTIEEDGKEVNIGIERIHMEEDTAKLTHDQFGRGTLIDFNRSGVPLIEIVSKPEMHSADMVIKYLEKLRKLLIYIGASECKMEEGGLRADVNISVSKTSKLGERAEIKNMNSFKSIKRAIEYEVNRQIEIYENGGSIKQQTLRWDDIKGKTEVQRSKETAKDYRYFPEEDLMELKISDEYIEKIRKEIPELLDVKEKRYSEKYNLTQKQISYILSDNALIELFEKTNEIISKPKEIANYMISEIAQYINTELIEPKELKITAEQFAKFIKLIQEDKLNSKTGKIVIEEMLKTAKDPEQIIEEKGLIQITDNNEIIKIVEEVLKANPQSIIDYKNGKDKALGFLVGQCMKLSKGKANPQLVNKIILEKM